MDEGGIYEEGSPDDIFDNPQKELTRRFIRGLKVFEVVVDSKGYDFYSFNSELDDYLFKNDVPSPKKYHVSLAIEEVVQQILLPHLKKPFIRIKVEYSLKEEECRIIITYKGDKYDINTADNELSLTILGGIASELKYSYNKEDEESNCIKITI
jgi:polar amino acid transport system ATP-binding protein